MESSEKESSEKSQNELTQFVNTESNGAGEENLHKVREILFGENLRDYDQRLGRVEARLFSELEKMRDDFTKRTESLERFVKDESKSLGEALAGEQKERLENREALEALITELRNSFEEKLRILTEKTGASDREMREQVLEQSKSLRNELTEANQQLSAGLESAVNELKKDKTSRIALASLLNDVALRLSEGE